MLLGSVTVSVGQQYILNKKLTTQQILSMARIYDNIETKLTEREQKLCIRY